MNVAIIRRVVNERLQRSICGRGIWAAILSLGLLFQLQVFNTCHAYPNRYRAQVQTGCDCPWCSGGIYRPPGHAGKCDCPWCSRCQPGEQAEGAPVPSVPTGELPLAPSDQATQLPSMPETSAPQLAFSEQASAVGGSTIAVPDVGYIDTAIPISMFRLRYDAAYRNPTPDRAEFLYPQCGCFPGPTPGPLEEETRIDFQDIRAHLELALWQRFSAFVEVPVRFLNPDNNANTAGLGDVEAGFKYAFIASPNRFVTGQLRVFSPTADANAGLGTGHGSLEPALLFFRRYSERLRTESEFRVWIPISDSEVAGEDFAGVVLRYGVGLDFDLIRRYQPESGRVNRLTSVTEFVGWSVLDGLALDARRPPAEAVTDADTTIMNIKLGMRWTAGRHSIYTGYGRALTGAVWYKDILRLEYRRLF